MAAVTLVLAGCRIEVGAALDLREDGSGSAALELFLDRELLNLLDEVEVDAITEVEAAAAEADDWTAEIEAVGADGVRLRLAHRGPDPAGALGELSAGLARDDPGLFADLDVRVYERADGPDELELAGRMTLAAPQAPGVIDESGEPLGPDRATLEALTREHVTAALVVTMPGTLQAHTADGVDGSTLRWELPVGETVEVSARSTIAALPVPRSWLLAGAGALLAVVLVAGAWLVRRR